MGYEVTFSSGETIVFDTEPTIDDIDEADKYLQRKKSKNLIDKIPGLLPEIKDEPDYTPLGVTKHIAKSALGGIEGLRSVMGGLIGGMTTGPMNLVNEATKYITPGIDNKTIKPLDQAFIEGASILAREPFLSEGRKTARDFGEALNDVLAPLQGHVVGFAPPLLTKGPGIIGKKVPAIEPIKRDIHSILDNERIILQKKQLTELKKQEKELTNSILDGTITPEGLQEVNTLYEKRRKLERELFPEDNIENNLEIDDLISEQKSLEKQNTSIKKQINILHLENKEIPDNLITLYDEINNQLKINKQKLGELQEKSSIDNHEIFENPFSIAEEKIKKVQDNPQSAYKYKENALKLLNYFLNEPEKNSSVIEALKKEIEFYSLVIKENELSLKVSPEIPKVIEPEMPLEATGRPLEGVKTLEVIPEPISNKKNLSTKEIDDIMASFPKERNTITDNATVISDWNLIEQIRREKENIQKEIEKRNNRHKKSQEDIRQNFERNQRPPSENSFIDREQFTEWKQQQIQSIIKEIKQVQNAINWAKTNKKDSIPFLDKSYSLEELINHRETLNKTLEKYQEELVKSFFDYDQSKHLPKTEEELQNILANTEVSNTSNTQYTAKSSLKRLNGIINKYEKILNRLRENIFNRENGSEPSGTPVFRLREKEYGLEEAKGLEEQLTKRYNHYINNRDRIQKLEALKKQEELRNNPKTEFPTIDESLVITIKEKRVYNSVEDILLNNPDHPIQGFIDNPHLFQQLDNLDIHIEKAILENHPEIEKTIQTLLHRVGLEKDKIYIITGEGSSNVSFHGNTSLIKINVKQIPEMMKVYSNDLGGKSTLFKKLFVGSSEKAMYHYTMAKIISHEMGHIVFTKWLKFGEVSRETFEKIILDFEVWKKNNNIKPTTFLNTRDLNEYEKYHSVFDEYFAEQTTKAILHDSLLNRFNDNTLSLSKQIKQLIDNTKKYLMSLGIHLNIIPYKQNLINSIISRNKEEITKTGRTIWEKMEVERNDKLLFDNPSVFPFANKTLQEIRERPYEVLRLSDDGLTTEIIPWQRLSEHPNLINLSNKALIALGNSPYFLARKFFGKTTFAQIFKNNPLIQKAHSIIRNAEYRAAEAANNLWFGNIVQRNWDNTSILQKFSKIKLPESPYLIHKNLTNLEAFNIHEVFKKGIEEALDYPETLQKYGSHLTQTERNAFLVFGNMFKKQYEFIRSLQDSLGKKSKLIEKPGWYPSVRNGDFFITIHYDGNVIYRQHFETKAAAEAWKKQNELKIPEEYTLGEIGNIKDTQQNQPMFEIIDIFAEYLNNAHNLQFFDVVNEFKTKAMQDWGKFGKHHEKRSNMLGYKGSELNLSSEESGHSFKEALSRNIDEFQSLYKTMLIKHQIDPMLLNDVVEGDQTHSGIKQMRDSALNVIPNNVEAFDKSVYEITDKIAKTIYESLYPAKEFAPTTAIYKTIQNNMIGLFYLFKVLPSLSMFITQLFSPIQAIRHAAYDGGFRSIYSFGKGLYKLLSKDKNLMESLFDATQHSDVIEPQFIKTLHLQGENKLMEWLKDWVAMRKPQEAADIFSRVVTYAYLHTHYTDIYPKASPKEINSLTRNGVDATMGAYSRAETAPIFKNLGGIIGESARPLQTFGQMTVGNLVADIKNITDNPTKLKSYAPFIMYGITSTIMGGVLSGAIMTQYETTRKLLMNINPQWELPSILDLISTGVVQLDSVVEDPEAATKLIAYGVLSSSTGIDIGASARTTETLPGNILTVLLALTESENDVYHASNAIGRIFPAHSNAIQMAHGTGIIGKKIIGGNVKNSDLRQSITDVSMRGPMKNALMELTGANKTTILGKKTNNLATGAENKMSIPEGPKEKVAHWLGNLSTDERLHTDLKLEREFKERAINDRIKTLYTLYNENPKEKYLTELIELGATDKNIKSQLQTRAYNALVDQDIRFITNSRGKVTNNPTTVRKLQGGLFRFGQKESPN